MILIVAAAEAGERLDRFVADRLPALTRSRVQDLIREGHVTRNGAPARPADKVRDGDEVDVRPPPPRPSTVEPEAIPFPILYEDHDLIVIDKPAGLVVHPAPGHPSGTLVNALLYHCHDLAGVGGELRPGIVHRLDRDTSGVMVVTKNDAAHDSLSQQFKSRTVEKVYQAIVYGHPRPPSGSFETLYGRHPRERKKFSSRVGSGKRAVTRYRTVEELPGSALMEVRLETGRTHQIRVHFADHGHPLVGDRVYGARPKRVEDREARQVLGDFPRQALHAWRLAFDHPRTGERLSFTVPLPPDMVALLAALHRIAGEENP